MSDSKRADNSASPPSPRPVSPSGLSLMQAAIPGHQPAAQPPQLAVMHAPVPGPGGGGAAPAFAAPVAPPPRVPLTIDGRPAVHVGAAADGLRIFEPMRDPANPGAGTSPYPHYSEGVGGAPGHLSDLSVHQAPQAPSSIARMRQTYVAPLGGVAPDNRNDRYVDAADGVMQRRAAGVFTPQAVQPLSPRTSSNPAARTDITFEPL